jgi:hypothetical protein
MRPQSDFFVASRDSMSNHDDCHLCLLDRLMERRDRSAPHGRSQWI